MEDLWPVTRVGINARGNDSAGVILLWPKADGKIDSPGGSDLSFGNQQKVVKFQNSDNVMLRLAKSQIGPVGHTMLLTVHPPRALHT